MKRNKFYLLGNAHLDPMWQWRWQEGSMEAKATLRSALDRMKEFPHFRFVCSSAVVYKWVEDFAPEMLSEIKDRVKEGRFIIVGGWMVEPDCNLPSGEGFARQALYAGRYFKEIFGKSAETGWCVDSFGHTATLPMLLREAGMKNYIFMRPNEREASLDSDVFYWTAPDGSKILTYRIISAYNSYFTNIDELCERISYIEENAKTKLSAVPMLYGVGNHGGGPTIRHLKLLKEYEKAHPEAEFIYSDTVDFFNELRGCGDVVPTYKGELQHHASGCYAAESRVKTALRRAECELSSAESYGMLKYALLDRKPDTEAIRKAWEEVCFCHFHDSLGGCSIKEAHDDTLLMLGYARNIAAREENRALQTLSWQIDTTDNSLGQPLVVFNPHSFKVSDAVRVNGDFNRVYDADGRLLPSQSILSSTEECYARPDTLFTVEVPALGYRVYYLAKEDKKAEFKTDIAVTPAREKTLLAEKNGVVIENEFYRIQFENYSGYIISFYDKKNEREIISDRAAVPVVFDEYYHDTWSHRKNFFSDGMARFSDAEVTLLEDGPVRAAVKVKSRYNGSFVTEYFYLYKNSPHLKIKVKVDWREKHKLLKIKWPFALSDPKAFYKIPFGIIERPTDGEEEPSVGFTAVKGKEGGFALLNDGCYSNSVKENVLWQTVLRSPIYGDHGQPRNSESEFTSQGEFTFNFTLMPAGDDNSEIIKECDLLNTPLSTVLDTWHGGNLPKTLEGLSVNAKNVTVTAIKRSEDGKATVIRILEHDGKNTAVKIEGAVLPKPLETEITPYSVQTYYLADGEDEWERVLFTEYKE